MGLVNLILLFGVCGSILQLTGASYVGCHKESGPFRHYSRSPGNYDPSTLTINYCQQLCGLYKHAYAAMADSNFCFCSNSLIDSASFGNDYQCMSVCPDGSTDKCGTQYYVAVYRTALQIHGYVATVSSPSNQIVSLHEPARFGYSIESGTDAMVYSWDFGDGAGRTKPNLTNMEEKKFSMPGEKIVTGYAADQNGLTAEKKYSVKVLAQAPAQNITLQCPEAVATWEEFSCNASVKSGSNMLVNMDWGDGSKDNFSVADPWFFAAGPAVPNVPAVTTTSLSAASKLYVMPGSEFSHEGTLHTLEYHTDAAGSSSSLDVFHLTPDCISGSYCHQTKSCETSCSGNNGVKYGTVNCAASQFCSAKGVCTSNCGSSNRYTTNQPKYKIASKWTIPSVNTNSYGSWSIPESEQVTVTQGDVLGYKAPLGGALISTRSLIGSETPDVDMNTATTTISTSLTLSTGTGISGRHLLRGIATRSSWIKFYHTYDQVGVYNAYVTVATSFITSQAQDSAQVTVELGIDYVIIDTLEYGKTSSDHTFNIVPHQGNNVTYYWNFGDGTIANTTSLTITHKYNARGSYNVTVTGANSISSKENTTTVIIEDCIENITISNIPAKTNQNHNFVFNAPSGSDFTCVWKMGHSNEVKYSNSSAVPINGGIFVYKYTAAGNYSVEVNCSNHVCNSVYTFTQIVQDVITGLDVKKRGGIVGSLIRIDFLIATGTDAQFNVSYNNSLLNVLHHTSYEGYTDQINGAANPGIADLVVNSWNLVSSETLYVNFTIEQPITKPNFMTSLGQVDYIMKGESCTFTASAESGTSVEIYWNFGDGSTDNHITPPLSVWPLNQQVTKSHTFATAGSFVVTVTVKNNFDEFVFNKSIDVYNKVANLTLQSQGAVKFTLGQGNINFWFSSSGELPTKAQIEFNWGDGKTEIINSFGVGPHVQYSHTYLQAKTFTVTANVSNLISYEVYTTQVAIVVAVENLGLLLFPSHAVVNKPVTIAIHMDKGSGVSLDLSYGDGSANDKWNRIGIYSWDMDNKTHTYTSVSTQTITVIASNILGNTTKTYTLFVQDPVTNDFTLTASSAKPFVSGSNTMTFDLKLPGGITPPSAPELRLDYGDGSGPQLITPWPFSGSPPYSTTFTHGYTKPGAFNVTVTISNLASSVTFTATAGVYTPITSLTGEALWQKYPDVYETGFTNNMNYFRQDKEVLFNMTYTGTIEQLRMMAMESNGSALQLCNYTSAPILVSFSMPGTWDVNITAWNELQEMSWTYSLVVFQAPVGLKVTDNGLTIKPNTTKAFDVSFQEVGADTSLIVEWGDGTNDLYANGVISNTMSISHNYKKKGKFTLKATAVVGLNIESITATRTVWVSDYNCNAPRLAIQTNMLSTDYANPIQVFKSSPLQIIALTTLDCSTTLTNSKKWVVERIDHNMNVLETVDLNKLSTSYSQNNPDFYVPPRALNPGNYRCTLNVKMVYPAFTADEEFASEVYTFVRVIESPLLPALAQSGLSMTTQGTNTTINFNALTFSKDPDIDPTIPIQGFTNFAWECRNGAAADNTTHLPIDYNQYLNTVNPKKDGCFGQGNGLIDLNKPQLTFTTAFMTANEIYDFSMTVFKGTRKATTSFQVKVVAGDPPELAIICTNAGTCKPRSSGLSINPSSILKLVSSCVGMSSCPQDMTFEWLMYRKGLVNSWILVEDFATYVTGLNSYEITIDPKLFADGYAMYQGMHTYRISLKGTVGGSTGQADTVLQLNQGPRNGNCSINSTQGVEFVDYFHLQCTGWYDEDGISNYKFYAMFKDNQVPIEISFSYRSAVDVLLPLGPQYDNYNMHIYAKIYDSQGVYTEESLGIVTVTRRSEQQFKAALSSFLGDSQNAVEKAAQAGNIAEANIVFSSYASALNTWAAIDQTAYYDITIASHNTAGGYGPVYQNYYTYGIAASKNYSANGDPNLEKQLKLQYEHNRDERAKIRKQIAVTLSEMTLETAGDIQQSLSTISMASLRVEEFPREAQMASMTLMNKIDTWMNDFAKDTPIAELQTIAILFLSATGSALEAGRQSQYNPTISDIDSSLLTPYYDYDGSIEAIRTNKQGFQGLPRSQAQQGMQHQSGSDRQTNTMGQTVSTFMSTAANVLVKTANEMGVGSNFTVTTEKLAALIDKNKAEQVTGKKYSQGNGTFTLPSWCEMLSSGANCNPNETITLVSMVTPTNPMGNVPYSNDVPFVSGTVTIDLVDRSGNRIDVQNTQTPIVLDIPRMSNVTPPVPANYTALIPNRNTSHLFYNSFNVTAQHASLHITIKPADMVQLLVLVRFGEFPKLNRTNQTHPEWDHLALIPHNITALRNGEVQPNEDPYMIFIDNVKLRNYQGKVILGMRQLAPSEYDSYSNDDPNKYPPHNPVPFTGRFTTTYTVRLFTSGCYFISNLAYNQQWNSNGCRVTNNTTYNMTQCSCNHLTTFAGGFAVQPNAIDFNFVFQNMDFYKNMTLYITEMLILVIYVVVAIWARRQDCKDIEKLGVTPLPDNDPKDRYLYEVQISTGSRKNAATDSKVRLILSGEYDETDVRIMEDPKRKLYRRGNTDSFLMATARPLGPIQYARIWHDNTGKGKFQGWYARFIVVHDLQTKEKFFFIINEWFAVEEADGQIDRVIPVAGPENMVEFNVLFSQKTRKNLSDEHIWFSVIARPPKSRFTRLQRVTCCLCLLFTSMLANAMFYETIPGGASQNGFVIGPFSLSPEQIYIGIISNLIVFPVNFLLVTLFRKSRPRKKRPSRIQDALDKAHYNDNISTSGKDSDKKVLVDHADDSQFSTIDSRASTPKLSPAQPLQPAHQPNMTTLNMDTFAKSQKKEKEKKKKKAFTFPWWCRIVGWILLWLTVLVCAGFVTFYGVSFGDVKCKKWITSMVISFITSIFLTQPIKVFLVAMLFALFFKKVDLEEEGDEDEEEIKLNNDETWLHQYPDADGIMPITERKVTYRPPDPAILEKAREQRLKELKMYDILREILFYSVYVWILLVVSYAFRDPNAFVLKKSLTNIFVDAGLGKLDVSTADNDFRKVVTYDNFFNWLELTLVPGIRAGRWYNNENPLFQRGMVADRISRMMGYATLRQLRVKHEFCQVPIVQLRHMMEGCDYTYNMFNEDTADYGVSWHPLQVNGTWNNSKPEYTYRTGASLDSYPYWAKQAVYSGGGYVVELKGSKIKLNETIQRIKQEEWIDNRTRAVFVEFTVYNANTNLFGIVTLVAEFLTSGGILTSFRIDPMNLLGYISSVSVFQIICEILYLLFIVFFIIKEIRNMYKERKSYFRQFWNWVEVCIIVLSITCVVIYFYRWYYSKKLTELFKVSKGNAYMKFQYAGYWNEILIYFLGMLCFLGSIKFIRLLRFNRRIGMLASTLRYGAKSLFLFLIMFLIMFMAYAMFFYLVYYHRVDNFRTIIITMETLIQMLVGKFNFNAMQQADKIMGPLVFSAYVVTVYYILLNMFLTILNESFATVRADINQQLNDHEMVEFIIQRFKTWTGFESLFSSGKRPALADGNEKPKIENQLQVFPEKVDRLLDILCKAYINSDYFDAMFDSNSQEGKAAMKNLIKASKDKSNYHNDDALEGACAYPNVKQVKPWSK